MTKFQLYHFLKQNNIEVHVSCEECLVFIPYCLIEEFTKLSLCKDFLQDERDKNSCLQDECLVFDITGLCEYFEIDINDIANEDGLL